MAKDRRRNIPVISKDHELMQVEKYIFLRNDDVRDTLDNELIKLTELSLKHQFPISHAVEPANVTREVVDWLLEMKKNNPGMIEIIQHGYDHNKHNAQVKSEFGGNRDYTDQFAAIKKGKELMSLYFGDLWSPVFTFPYGTYNAETLRAINDLEYKAISGKVTFTLRNKIKNLAGRRLQRDFLFRKKISYHSLRRRRFAFYEFSVSANLIRKYTGQNTAVHYTKEEVLSQIELSACHTDKIGILFHHRFHKDHFNQIDELLGSLKQRYKSSTIMSFIR